MADVLSNTMNVADKMNSEQLTEFSSSLLGTFGALLTPSSQSSDGVRKSQSNLCYITSTSLHITLSSAWPLWRCSTV